MKTSHAAALIFSLALSLLANATETGHGESTAETPSSTADDSNKQTCDNGGSKDGKECSKCKSNGAEPATQASNQTAASSSPGGVLHSFSGDGRRDITDLQIAGASGSLPLEFTRYSMTRLPSRNLGVGAFGREGSWCHNYEWTLRDNSSTRKTLTLLTEWNSCSSPPAP